MKPAPAPTIRKASQILGKTLMFRDVSLNDAGFILGLRTDEQKSRYLSVTTPDLKQQQEWIQRYLISQDQAYFLIATKDGEPLGTVRLYDAQGDSFCWGSWIIKSGAPVHAAIESALMVYAYALDFLGFSRAHFDVRKANEHVWRFHERFGATRVGESALDYYYRIEPDAIAASRQRYRRYLPEPISVEWL